MAAMQAQTLADGELELDFPADSVARLTLSNPDKRNPLSHPVLDALAETLPALDHGIDVRCVIITGAGRAFSAGYDLGGIPEETFEREAEALVAHPFTDAMEAVSRHPYPMLAAINGHCLGGGVNLVHEPDLLRARGVEVATGEEQLLRPRDTHGLDEPLEPGVPVDQAELGGRHPELGLGGADPQVAADGKLQPSAEAVAVDRRQPPACAPPRPARRAPSSSSCAGWPDCH
jgi:hypothetical protein